jgi:transcriptional regulator with XRE-family HTH domain
MNAALMNPPVGHDALGVPQGYTQESFSEVADISRSYISAIEAPNVVKSISLEILFKVADSLKIEPYKLLEFRE